MKIYTIQNSFAAGEVSPLMFGRSDTEAYKSGGETISNMISDARGPAYSRPGGQHIYRFAGDIAKGGKYAATNGDVFAIIFTDLLVSFFDMSDLTIAPVSLVTIYPADAIQHIKLVESPTDETIYLFHPEYQTQKLKYDINTSTWTIETVAFTAAPANWTGSNWPSCGTFIEGRLWVGGAPDAPAEFWASKSNAFENMTTGSTAADAFNRTIAFKGKILWMEGVKSLVIGTTTAEFICSSQDGVMWNEDIQIDRQSTYGSKDIQTAQIGDQVVYVSPDGKKLRAIEYEWSKNNWVSKELTFISEHISESGIKDLSWSQNPDNLMWIPLENGDMVSLSYNRSNDIYGWNSHSTAGTVLDCFSVEYLGTSSPFALISREDGFIDLELFGDKSKQMDSYIEQDLGSPSTVVTGLDHLEGLEIQILGDGAVQPNKTVVSGSVTLSTPATVVLAGRQFTPILRTLPISQLGSIGNNRTFAKGYSDIYIQVSESYIPLINGERAPERSPSTPMGQAEAPITGLIKVGGSGFDEEAIVEIKQDLPLPLTVLAIYGHLTADTL